jgi:hypothetical protein
VQDGENKRSVLPGGSGKTWLEAQITLINLEQAKIEEVFLPYLILPGEKTLFETMEQNQFLLPETHTPEEQQARKEA